MEEGLLTIGDYWEMVKRRRMSLILISTLVISMAAILTFLLPSIYRSSATLMIEEQHIPQDFVMTTVNTYAEQRVENIKQRVLSFSELSKIINQFNLYSKLKEKWTLEEVVNKMRNDIMVETISAEMIDRRTGRPTAVTTAFTVSYEGRNPQAVLRVTDALSSRFMEQNLKKRQQQVSETSIFLASEAKRIKVDLIAADGELADFKKKHINELPELFQVNMQTLSNLQRDKERLNAELRTLREREGYLNVQLSSVSPYLSNLEESRQEQRTLNELRVQLSSLQQRYTDKYPDILSLKAQIREMEKQGHASSSFSKDQGVEESSPDNPAYITLKSQLASTVADIQSVRNQVGATEDRVRVYRKRIEETPKVEEEYQALVSHRNSLQSKYNDLVQKHQEARVAQELEKDQKGERFTLIEPARFPEKPARPNRMAFLLIGAVLGLGSSVGFAAIREFTDQSVHTTEALAALTAAPVLVGMPRIVTTREKQKNQMKVIVTCLTLFALLCAAVAIFHFYIMDLHIFGAKVMRKFAQF